MLQVDLARIAIATRIALVALDLMFALLCHASVESKRNTNKLLFFQGRKCTFAHSVLGEVVDNVKRAIQKRK